MSLGLLLCDFMARQVLVPAFPELADEWSLSHAQLAALSSVLAVSVGVLTVPLSLAADRFGRARAVQTMAVVWSAATLACALAPDYAVLLGARVAVGAGEAAYGSVGLAMVLTVFPVHRRASLAGAFLAAGPLGAAIGVAFGGLVTAHLGWRWAVGGVAALGLLLAAVHRLVISDGRLAGAAALSDPGRTPRAAPRPARFVDLVAGRPLRCAYVASGLQLAVAGALLTWLPTWLVRTRALPPDRAAVLAAVVAIAIGVGMIGCGWLTDRLGRSRREPLWTTAAACSLTSLLLLVAGFTAPDGPVGLVLVAVGALFVAGPAGATGALVASLAPEQLRAGALGVLALANNLLGLAAGPAVVGVLADRLGLADALALVPALSLAAIAVLLVGRRGDLRIGGSALR